MNWLRALQHLRQVHHNITVGAGLPRPYNEARVQLKSTVNPGFAVIYPVSGLLLKGKVWVVYPN